MIGGRFFCGVDDATILRFGLRKDLFLTDEQLDEVFAASGLAKLYRRALDFLAYRPRSEREVSGFLRRKITNYKILNEQTTLDQVIDAVIVRLRNLNYVNDDEFARWWIQQRVGGYKPMGWRKIQLELAQKGIPRSVIESIRPEVDSEERQGLVEYFERIKGKYSIGDTKDRQRLVRHLLGRGFAWDQVKTMLK